jgi:Zn finger protein HypA/HybF involved in hydrogenase expression
MSDVYNRQKVQEDLQKNDAISMAFGKLISGKAGYKAVIEKKPMVIKCKECGNVLDVNQKFCHECGARVEKQAGK